MGYSHFHATAWNNGSHHSTGAGYGLRMGSAAREQYFDPSWTKVMLYLSGDDEPVETNITLSFWRSCVELRDNRIGKWLIRNGYASWERGHPPEFQVARIGERTFKVSPAEA